MNVLVTGGSGQLGLALQELARQFPDLCCLFFDLPDLDVTDEAAVDAAMSRSRCHAVVNCAAYTAVDQAERDLELAFRVNRDAVGVLARRAETRDVLLVHISTDYVFSGNSFRPYTERDTPDPLGVYGRSKLEGERLVREIGPSHIILRTSWLYSLYGRNFLTTMLRLGRERDRLEVVVDQVGTPTCALDLAGAILTILSNVRIGERYAGLYHYSNEGVCSWYDFAVSIMRMAMLPCRVFPIGSAAYPSLAPRPAYSVLDKAAIKEGWGLDIAHWQDSLGTLLARSGS